MADRVAGDDESWSILYARSNARFRTYDANYANNNPHFSLANGTVAFVKEVVEAHRARLRSVCVVELGCGQGELLDVTRRLIAEQTGECPRCLGVDGSLAGIVAAAASWPECVWVADTAEGFFDRLETGDLLNPIWLHTGFDLILDKTGLTFLTDEAEARNLLRRVYRWSTPGAMYLYTASRGFYDGRLSQIFDGWSLDWMSMLADIYDAVEVHDAIGPGGGGYYQRVYIKRDLSESVV